jgi:hypothetical protein
MLVYERNAESVIHGSNGGPCHIGLLGSGGLSPRIYNIATLWTCMVRFVLLLRHLLVPIEFGAGRPKNGPGPIEK